MRTSGTRPSIMRSGSEASWMVMPARPGTFGGVGVRVGVAEVDAVVPHGDGVQPGRLHVAAGDRVYDSNAPAGHAAG